MKQLKLILKTITDWFKREKERLGRLAPIATYITKERNDYELS